MIVIKMHNEVSYSIVSRKYYNTGNDFDHNTSHSSFEAIIISQRVLNRYRTCNKQILLYMRHYFKSKSTRCTFF